MQTTTARPKQILLVDDDSAFAGLMKEFLLLPGRGPWIVHTAENYTEALACLKVNPVDLVVLDIRLPIMDGLQFLKLLRQTHPGLPVVILTGLATEENRAYSLEQGAALFLDKTSVAGGFEGIYAALEAVATKPAEGFRGMLRQVGLTDVLQMECLGRKSSVLEISTQNTGGKIFIQDGSIIHAESGSQQGEPALFRLLTLSGGEFHLKPFSAPARQTIDGHWESLLMEAARLHDEAAGKVSEESAESEASAPETGLQPGLGAATAPAPERRVDEIVLCSGTGEVFYEWQAQGIERRAHLLEQLSIKSAALGKILPFGRAERLEVVSLEGRIVVVLEADRKVFVRSLNLSSGELVTDSSGISSQVISDSQ